MQLLWSVVYREFARLGGTFAAITLEDSKRRILLNTPNFISHERLILTSVTQHQLHARLVHQSCQSSPTVLRFSVFPAQGTSNEHSANVSIRHQWQRLRQLLENLQSTQRRLAFGNDYVEYMRASLKRGDSRDQAVSLQTELLANSDFDEEMMKDLH